MPIPIGYQEAVETPKTSRATEAIWSFRAASSGQSVILPDGRCDLILRAFGTEPTRFIPVVTGPALSAYTVNFNPGDVWVGLRLRPERAITLWGAQMGAAQDQVARGPDAEALLPALAESPSGLDPIARLKRAVPGDGGKTAPKLTHAIDLIHASGGRLRVEQLAAIVGCSARHLNRLFLGHVGLGAKPYLQLAQFHRTLRLICSGRISLSQAAFEGGYADHAHMTRAFRRFGGFTPAAIPSNLDVPKVFQAHV